MLLSGSFFFFSNKTKKVFPLVSLYVFRLSQKVSLTQHRRSHFRTFPPTSHGATHALNAWHRFGLAFSSGRRQTSLACQILRWSESNPRRSYVNYNKYSSKDLPISALDYYPRSTKIPHEYLKEQINLSNNVTNATGPLFKTLKCSHFF